MSRGEGSRRTRLADDVPFSFSSATLCVIIVVGRVSPPSCFSFFSSATRSFSFSRSFRHVCQRSFQLSKTVRRMRRRAIDLAKENVVATKSETSKDDKARISDPAKLKRARNQSARISPTKPPAFSVQPKPKKLGKSSPHKAQADANKTSNPAALNPGFSIARERNHLHPKMAHTNGSRNAKYPNV